MPVLPHKSVLAVAAVVDLALNARNRRVTAKVLAARHHLSPDTRFYRCPATIGNDWGSSCHGYTDRGRVERRD